MVRFISYTKAQLKRTFRVFPFTVLMTAALAAVILMIFWMQMQDSGAEKQRIVLGVVGESNGEYMGFGIYTMQNLDSSRFAIDMQQFEKEEEARSKLINGEINAYLFIPHGFMQSIVEGSNKAVKLVANENGTYMEIISELARAISKAITESQAGVFSLQDCYLTHGYRQDMYSDSPKLNLSYFDLVLGREDLYDIEEISGSSSVSTEDYYLCAGVVMFMLLWGMNGAVLFIQSDHSLTGLLKIRGISPVQQCAGEFIAYYISGAVLTVIFCAAVSLAGARTGFAVPLLILACLTAMQYLLFSIVSRLIEGLILNFIVSIAMGYISGCFYPMSFFPEGVQLVSSLLPAGASMNLLQEQIAGNVSIWSILTVALWGSVFFALSVIVRRTAVQRYGNAD